MKKLFFATTISSALILGACGNSFIENDKEDDKTDNKQTAKKNKDEQQENNQNENTSNQESKNEISENEALKRAENVFSPGSYHGFKIDQSRTNNSEYFITFLLNDAVGTPQSSATTVNKQTGEVGDYIDDRTEKEKEDYIKFIRESPKYKGSTEKLEELAKRDRSAPHDEILNNDNNKQQETNQNAEQPEEPKENKTLQEKQKKELQRKQQKEDKPSKKEKVEQPKQEIQTQQKQEVKQPKEPKTQQKEPKEQKEPETQERREEE